MTPSFPSSGREVVIVEAVRTPIGRGHPESGYYRNVHAVELLGHAYSGLLERTAIDPGEVESVVAGCVHQFGEQSLNIARNGWLHAGLPISTSATTIDTQCGSAQQAVNYAAALIASGVHDVVIGAGVEHMAHVPMSAGAEVQEHFGPPFTERLLANHEIVGQALGAELIADDWELSRSELDHLALRSHQLAADATDQGLFARETVPVHVDGEVHLTDQGIRRDTSLERLSQLRAAFKPDGKLTAGNSSQISDGAAAVLLMTRQRAQELGLRPRARILDQTSVGCDPVRMLEGPIPVTTRLLERNGMSIDDVQRFEINEAFAPVVLAWARHHRPDMERVNVRGGAIALGHPLGSSGARLVATLLHTLEDDDLEIGLVAMCCGGGIGTGTVLQRV